MWVKSRPRPAFVYLTCCDDFTRVLNECSDYVDGRDMSSVLAGVPKLRARSIIECFKIKVVEPIPLVDRARRTHEDDVAELEHVFVIVSVFAPGPTELLVS